MKHILDRYTLTDRQKRELLRRYKGKSPRQVVSYLSRMKGVRLTEDARRLDAVRNDLLDNIIVTFGPYRPLPKSTGETIAIRRPIPYNAKKL